MLMSVWRLEMWIMIINLGQAVARRLPKAGNLRSSREFSFLKYFLHRTGKIIVKLRQGSGKEGQGMALKAKGLKA